MQYVNLVDVAHRLACPRAVDRPKTADRRAKTRAVDGNALSALVSLPYLGRSRPKGSPDMWFAAREEETSAKYGFRSGEIWNEQEAPMGI